MTDEHNTNYFFNNVEHDQQNIIYQLNLYIITRTIKCALAHQALINSSNLRVSYLGKCQN